MDKYQIVETTEQFNHAGTKATADISVVAEKMGFQKLYLKMRTTKAGYLAIFTLRILYKICLMHHETSAYSWKPLYLRLLSYMPSFGI